MFNRVKYFITKNFKKPFTKERFIKNNIKYIKPQIIRPTHFIIRKYHTLNTNFNNNKPPKNNMLLICSIAIGTYFSIKNFYKCFMLKYL
jgi:hypothetical protein